VNTTQAIKEEIDYFKVQNIKGKFLKNIFNALMSISPTSIDSKRAFFMAESFCKKIRFRLEDETLNVLCLLGYFNNKKLTPNQFLNYLNLRITIKMKHKQLHTV